MMHDAVALASFAALYTLLDLRFGMRGRSPEFDFKGLICFGAIAALALVLRHLVDLVLP